MGLFSRECPMGSLGRNSDNTIHRSMVAIARIQMISSRNCFLPNRASILAVEQSDCEWLIGRAHRSGVNGAPFVRASIRLVRRSRFSLACQFNRIIPLEKVIHCVRTVFAH